MKGETTIQLSRETVDKLTALKVHPRQSYQEVISKLIIKKPDYSNCVVHDKSTTIQVSKEMAEKLSSLKIHPRQSYEEVLQGLL